ncbi:protein mesh-like [Stegodyphus dumicola]|uniref:protein mesh-like n=1 Tax=Stegodyphus dumicola TaxID=202533 RepID=UPI0015AACEC7|nr:protein mesh-like [Stegodyphus dumicola]
MAQLLWMFVFACSIQFARFQSAGKARENNAPLRAPTFIDMKKFRSELLYPHDREYLIDTINRGQAIRDTPLIFRLPFFGFDFRYIWIHRDGYILFNKGLLEYPSPVKFPTPFIRDPSREEDPSLIAPWFSYQDIPNSIEGAGVYSQLINLASQNDEHLKERIRLDFKDAMIGSADFEPTYALIVTWRNVTHANRMPTSQLKTNTYQVVIATDEKRTYVMFNYDAINWISDKDNYDGQKGIPPFIGFNAGNRTRAYEFEPYSQQPRVSRLPSLGFGNGLHGRFYFQVDEEIWPGCCIERLLDVNWPTRPKLTFFPRYGSMLGGTMVNVTGPCFSDPRSIIRCKFDTLETDGIYRDQNHVSCISPPVMYHGYVDLSVSVDNGPFLFYARYYVQPPDMVEADVNVLDRKDKEEAPERFTVKWKHEKLTMDERAPVTIALWGYRESNENYPRLTYIDLLTEDTVISGARQYSLDLDVYKNRWNWDKLDIYFGFIAINLTEPEILRDGSRQSPVLWSGPLPLAWYFRHQWHRKYGKNWKKEICEDWYFREKYSDRFAITLFRCPCTVAQAKLDRGRFAPDLQCNEIDRKCETFHKSAYHCVRSGRPAVGGAGQLCCYDDHGELIRTGDTMYGGRPARAFQFGKHPFKQRMMIPALSYWLHDVSPYFFCCKWADGEDDAETCDMFKYWRTSQDCSLYQTPGVGSVYGDPHFVTFDRVNYTFNGKGEFVLTRVNHRLHKLDVQGRFEQPVPKYHFSPPINGTRLMAIAAKDNISSVVEFRVRPAPARWQYHMYIIVDNEYVYFWDNSLRVQYFKGVTLFQPANVYNMSHIVAMFDSGAGVEVMVENGHMAAHVYLPVSFINKTRGLLGMWSRNKDDDFISPEGDSYISPDSSTYDIHQKFGMAYRVSELGNSKVGRSLFFHNAIPFSQYDNISFVPEYQTPPPIPKNFSYRPEEVDALCSTSVSCKFDFIVTGDREFAWATRNHENYAQKLASDVRKDIVRCPELSKPRHGRKSEIRYYVGTTVRFTCDDGYRLVGYENRRCRETGLWSWGVDPQCISEADYAKKVIGISLGIILPVIILGILLCIFLVQRTRHRNHHHTGEKGQQVGFMMQPKPYINNRNGAGNGSSKVSDF